MDHNEQLFSVVLEIQEFLRRQADKFVAFYANYSLDLFPFGKFNTTVADYTVNTTTINISEKLSSILRCRNLQKMCAIV